MALQSSSQRSLAAELRAFAKDFTDFARGRLSRAIVLMLAGAVLEGVGLVLLVPMTSLLLQGGERGGILSALLGAIPFESQVGQMAVLLSLFVASIVVRAGVLTVRDRRLAILQFGFVEKQRYDLVAALARAPWAYVAGLRHAKVTAAIGTEVQMIAATAQLMLQSVVASSMLLAQWLLVLFIAPGLAALVVVLGALGTIAILPGIRRAANNGVEQVARQAAVMNVSGQMLAGLKLAKAQNAETAFLQDFRHHADFLTKAQLAGQRRHSRLRVASASLSAIVGAVMLLAGMWLGLPLAQLVTAIVILARMSGLISVLQQNAQQIASNLAAHASVSALRDDLGQSAGRAEQSSGPVPSIQSVGLEDVQFNRADGGGVQRANVLIHRGDVIGVAGPSGSGKTTFIDLLTGLLQPSAGRVLFNGMQVSAAEHNRFRDRMAYVAQDTYLLNDTIRRNLTWGGPAAVEADMWQALAATGAANLVRHMKDGLDTVIAERGSRLSGGERQRIAIARALLRKPDMMIFDEATNAIDVESERDIIMNLMDGSSRPTIILVAHRSETLRICERVFSFKDGQITACG